jgi:hypothetical protein
LILRLQVIELRSKDEVIEGTTTDAVELALQKAHIDLGLIGISMF